MDERSQGHEDAGPDPEVIAMIERALVAVRRDQSRRRSGAGEGAFGHGPHGGHGWGPRGSGGPWGAGGPEGRRPWGSRWPEDARAAGGQQDDGSPDGAGPEAAGERHGRREDGRSGPHDHGPHPAPWPADLPHPLGGAAFGDSARLGPGGRRGRDGSLGRVARFRMLEALEAADAEDRQLSISLLAVAIGVDQPRASRLVQEGVERGLVRRVPDPADARRALIKLTAAGRTQLDEVRTHRRSAVETALAAFTPEEARTFADLFDRFVRSWPRS